jgi:polysaccharide export outer membrane protein
MTYIVENEIGKDVERNNYQLQQISRVIIPHDELYIRVSSFDSEEINPFSRDLSGSMGVNVNLLSYTVNSNGSIHLPLLNDVYVKDLTLSEASAKIADLLQPYLTKPSVVMKFVSNNVTILGEVANPGLYTFSEEDLNIFQALGLAGDITIFGDRDQVVLIRKSDSLLTTSTISMNKDDFLTSNLFFIQDDDVIYVKPLKRRVFGFEEFPFPLLLSVVSTTLLTISFIQNNL